MGSSVRLWGDSRGSGAGTLGISDGRGACFGSGSGGEAAGGGASGNRLVESIGASATSMRSPGIFDWGMVGESVILAACCWRTLVCSGRWIK